MSIPEGSGTSKISHPGQAAPSTVPEDNKATPVGITGDQRRVTTVSGEKTQGFRAESGASTAPETPLSKRRTTKFTFKARWQNLVKQIKKLFGKEARPLMEVSTKELFASQQRHSSNHRSERYEAHGLHLTAPAGSPSLILLINNPELEDGRTVIRNVNFTGTQFDVKDFSGVKFVDCIFDNADLSHCTLNNTVFEQCSLQNTNMQEASGSDVQFENCNLTSANLSSAALERPTFKGSTLEKTSFERSTLSKPHILSTPNGKMDQCNFNFSHISEGNTPDLLSSSNSFGRATLEELNVDHMRLTSSFSGAKLENIHCKSSGVALNSRINSLTVSGGELNFGKENSDTNRSVSSSFYNSHFNGTKIQSSGARVNMTNVEFNNADISDTQFRAANWHEVKFVNNCNLQKMNTRNLEVFNSRFENCDLSHSDHVGNHFNHCLFSTCDMSEARIRHLENSTRGQIANTTFDQVTGLPDKMVKGAYDEIHLNQVTINNCTGRSSNELVTLSRPVHR